MGDVSWVRGTLGNVQCFEENVHNVCVLSCTHIASVLSDYFAQKGLPAGVIHMVVCVDFFFDGLIDLSAQDVSIEVTLPGEAVL